MPHAVRRALVAFGLALSCLALNPGAARSDDLATASRPAQEVDAALAIDAPPAVTTAHFRFFGAPGVHGTLRRLADGAEARLSLMCSRLGVCASIRPPIDVWVAEDAIAFAAAFPEPSPMSEWAAGVTFLDAQRVVLKAHGTAVFTLQETFDHELAHVLTHAFMRGHADGLHHWPRWFAEGLAIWLSGEAMGERLAEVLRAAGTGSLLTPEQVVRDFPIEGSGVSKAYGQAALGVRWLVREKGAEAILSALRPLARAADFDAAFGETFGVSPEDAVARGTEPLEGGTSFFYLFWDGQLIWGAVTVLFVAAAWWRLRERRTRLAAMGAADAAAVSAEDEALLATWRQPAEDAAPGDAAEAGPVPQPVTQIRLRSGDAPFS
jgi:hypothetical protein